MRRALFGVKAWPISQVPSSSSRYGGGTSSRHGFDLFPSTCRRSAEDSIWHGIDCREWFIKMVADDYHAEMETIDRMIEAELRR